MNTDKIRIREFREKTNPTPNQEKFDQHFAEIFNNGPIAKTQTNNRTDNQSHRSQT
jgi:hypothetical protein